MRALDVRRLTPSGDAAIECDGDFVELSDVSDESTLLTLDEEEARALYAQLQYVLDEPRP